MATDAFNTKILQANLVKKTDFYNKLSDLNRKIGVQNYLVFQLVHRYFKFISNTNFISEWISKGLSSESIKPPATSNNSFAPAINNCGTKTREKIYWKLFATIKTYIYS